MRKMTWVTLPLALLLGLGAGSFPRCAEAAEEFRASDVAALIGKAERSLEKGRASRALRQFERAWRLSNRQASTAALGCVVAALADHRLARAAEWAHTLEAAEIDASAAAVAFRRLAEARLDDAVSRSLADASKRADSVQRAVADLETSLALDPDAGLAELALARAHLLGGALDEARRVNGGIDASKLGDGARLALENQRCLLAPAHGPAGGELATWKPVDAQLEAPQRRRPSGEATRGERRRPVLVLAVIDESGAVPCALTWQGSGPEASEAVRQWRFEPARWDGQPVDVRLVLEDEQ